jgi:hypothetical protein
MRLCYVLLTCLLAGQANHPSITFEFRSKDLGTINQGRRIKEVFPFVNQGTAVLEITDIEKS